MFQQISQILGDGEKLSLTVTKNGDQISVLVAPKSTKVIPLMLSGDPAEIDREFVGQLAKHGEVTTGLVSTLEAAEKAAQETAKAAAAKAVKPKQQASTTKPAKAQDQEPDPSTTEKKPEKTATVPAKPEQDDFLDLF